MTKHERFWRSVTREGTAPCVLAHRDNACDGPLDAHHIVKAQRIRAYYQLPRYARELAEFDVRNGVALCRHHHHLITQRVIRLRADELPSEVWAFASDYALQWALEMELEPVEERAA